ncbi:MAG TPA: hypothetical protein GXZ90_02025 [Clostridiales bacterium]|nr:hypothetical protein [Clostridiales bacterium]
MANNKENISKETQKYIRKNRLVLICLLIFVSIATMACNKSNNQETGKDNNIEDINVPDPTTTEPTPTRTPEPIAEPTIEPTIEPTPTKDPTSQSETSSINDFIPSEKVFYSTTAFTQGNYFFYKTGKLAETKIVLKNLKTSEITEITTIEDSYFNSSKFYLNGSHIFYHAKGDIYRVAIDGKNKTRLFKGTATILGLHEDNLYALDRKNKEIIRIDKNGQKKSLVKINSIDSVEVIMVKNGFYFINKSSNNTSNGNDPIDRLYYVDLDGKNKIEIYKELDIYNMISSGNDIFFLTFSDESETTKLNKVKDHKAKTIHSFTKEELKTLGCNWLGMETITLLAVNSTNLYYGINFNDGKEMNIYSMGVDGNEPLLYRNAYDIEGMNPAAYFRSGNIDNGYLKIVFDCDEDPVEVFLINLKDDSVIKFKGGYYLPETIDVEGDYVYYLKSSDYDRYGESPETYKYGRSKISEFK